MIGKTVIAWTVSYTYFTYSLFPVQSTIDMNESEFYYIANHLSKSECRRLVASLQFLDYDLPSNFSDKIKEVPKNVACIQLLLTWNRGVPRAGGQGRSHQAVAHRLRQLQKGELADWLGNKVFNHLATDIDEMLSSYPFKPCNTAKPMPTARKHSTNKETIKTKDWTMYDTILWIGIIAGVSFAFYQVADRICAINRKRKYERCELQDLLIRENLDSDDDYASENMFYNRIEHFDED